MVRNEFNKRKQVLVFEENVIGFSRQLAGSLVAPPRYLNPISVALALRKSKKFRERSGCHLLVIHLWKVKGFGENFTG